MVYEISKCLDGLTYSLNHVKVQVNSSVYHFLKLVHEYIFSINIVFTILLPPPLQPSGRVLASNAGGPGFNPQSRTASYRRRYKNGTSSSLAWHSTFKREILTLSEELRQEKKCIDNIWDRKSFEVGRSLAVVAGMKK